MQDQPTAGPRPSVVRDRPPAIDVQRDALFLDIDGTLAPLAPRPQDVGPTPRRTALIKALSERLDHRLAVVTGRQIADADRILDSACAVVAGVHGLTIRCPDETISAAADAPAIQAALIEARAFAVDRPGVIVEDKGQGLTLHYRQAPERAVETVAFGRGLAASSGLRGQPGDMVYEIRQDGADKGTAVRWLMSLAPFAGFRPIFVGDDLTDEDGFRAVQALGGYAVLVGGRDGSVADYGLPDVEAVLTWLETT